MKKALSLLLSVLLVLSTITCLFTVATVHAETAAAELISNGGFENTSLQAVGTNFPGISGTTNPSSLVNGKWYRATGGLSYATYGDLSAYDAETDTVTKATATEYAKYFTACSTVVAQPDDATNHIGRAQQTMYQAINLVDGKTYNFKFKVRTTADTPCIWITLRGLQNQNTDGTVKVSDMTYVKMDIDVVNQTEGYTLTYLPGGNLKIVLDNPTEWTNVDIVAKVDAVAEPTPTRTGETIIETDFTMFGIMSDSPLLNSTNGTNGYMYRTTGMYLDDISLRAYTNPFGEAEFYKDGKKLENTNEDADIIATVNGKETVGFAVGDTVIATPDYNADGNTFVGWYKNGELYSREETITFTVNSTDVYAPKFISRNLLTETAASFEGYADSQSLRGTTTDYPEVGEWGTAANAGYLGATVAETVYDVDGNAYTQQASGTRNVTTNAATINADAYTGNNSLKLACSYHSFVTTLDVTPNTDYTLTYYVKGVDTDTTKAPVKIKTGILTTVNTSTSKTLTPQGEETHASLTSRYAVADYNNAFALAKVDNKVLVSDTWEKITLTFNSKNFETLYFGISPADSETFWVDELCLVAGEEAATLDVKFVDTKGNAIENANLYAKATVMEDFDGSNLLSIDYDDESGAYIFAGWYDSTDTRLSLDELYDYEGDLEGVYAKIISKNLFEASSFEGYENNVNVAVSDITKYPNEGEWGASLTAGYYKATYDEVIYDKYGYAYQQTASGTAGTYGAATITNAKAYKGSKSTLLAGNYATMVTGLDVEPNTNYTVTYYVLADTATTMKYTGIATTVNIAYQKTVTALDGGTLASGMTVAVGNMGDAYALSKLSALAVSNTEWLKVTHTFNSGDFEKVYLCICPTAGEKYYVDEISLVAEEKPETVSVKIVDANGDALAEDAAANVGVSAGVTKDIYTGVRTATVNYETGAYTFLGWYNAEDTLVSANKDLVVTGSVDGMYAKLQNNNLLTYAASYEGYENNTSLKYTGTDYPSGVYFGGNKNAGYLGATYAETIYNNKGEAIEQTSGGTVGSSSVNAAVTNLYAHTGNVSVKLTNSYWTASMGIDVEPNTDYALSYYMLAPKREDAVSNTIALSAISTTVNTGTSGTGSTAALNQATSLYLDSKDLTTVHDGENWVKVTHTFNSMNLNKVYLVIGQTSDTKAANCWAYIDDMTMIETTPTTMDVEMKSCASLDLGAASMDGLYIGQELTFKVIDNMDTDAVVTFNGKVITANTDGTYTVILASENALSVRFEGDDDLPWYDEDEFGRKLSENNHEVYSEPVWEGDTVYHETALFTPDKDTVKLLYPVDEIVSLRSYDLTQNYIEGYDFEITEDGQIKRLEGGRIPVWSRSLVTDTANDWPTTDGKYIVTTGDTTYPKYAISVTYKHSTTFADGYTPATPESQYADLNNVMTKLQNGEDVNIVIYGDSISCGWSSSGLNPDIKIYDDTNTEGNFKNYSINVAPYAPTWIQMFETELNSRYPDANINIKNLSLGGKSSPWGATNIAARLALWKDEDGNQVTPDLILIGFGVNDSASGTSGITAENFKANIEAIIDNAREASGNANMEALMYSPMFPNQASTEWPAERLLGYEAAMEEIAAADDNAGLLKLSSIFNEIVKNKAPEDYLNTNLNHGNDFTARLYYNGIMAAMTADENAKTTPNTPTAPVAETVTENSVTLVATEGYEYSMDGAVWQTSNVFEGLTENTEYTFYQRVAESDTNYVSYASAAATIKTAAAVRIGDVDTDGAVNLNDLITLAQYVAGWEDIAENSAMDVNGDGKITLEDVTHLSRHLAGWEDYILD